MGTRSTIAFINKYKDGEEEIFAKIYQQYDGYLEGVGRELCKWLLNKKIINGIGADQFTDEFANGFDDLATLFIADHKHGIGYLHLCEINKSINEYCDYNYEVVYNYTLDLPREGTPANDLITIRITNWGNDEVIFSGSPQELLDFIEKK